MMEDFKLFIVKNGKQVLFERNFNNKDEEDTYEICAVTHLDFVRFKMTHGYGQDEEKRDRAFNETCTLERAQEFYSIAEKCKLS